MLLLLLFRKSRKLVAVLGPMHERRFYVLFLRLYVLNVQKGGDLGYSFLTLVELNFEHWTNKKRGRKQTTERESSLSRVSGYIGNMAKDCQQQASIHYTGVYPSSPSFFTFLSENSNSKSRFTHIVLFGPLLVCSSV
jgi:hypothetical protein